MNNTTNKTTNNTLDIFLQSHRVTDNETYTNFVSQKGGKYFIPNTQLPRLYDILSTEIKHKRKFNLMENVGEFFKLFLDIDGMVSSSTNDETNDIVHPPSTEEIINSVKQCINFITRRNDNPVTINGESLQWTYNEYVNNKYNYKRHIIFDHIYINRDIFKAIHEQLDPKIKVWVDKASSGLRMPFAYKYNIETKKYETTKGIYKCINENEFDWNKSSILVYDNRYLLRMPEKRIINAIDDHKNDKTNFKYPEISIDTINQLIQSTDCLRGNYIYGGKNNIGFNLLKRITSSMCPVCKRIHDSRNLYIRWGKGMSIVVGCWAAGSTDCVEIQQGSKFKSNSRGNLVDLLRTLSPSKKHKHYVEPPNNTGLASMLMRKRKPN
jgi:hypothetical protein